MPAVYKILNNITGKFYIGSTVNVDKRKYIHFTSLRNGTHHCLYLQKAFKKYSEQAFSFDVIFTDDSLEAVRELEQLILDETFVYLYNTSKQAAGGDLLSYHPQKEDIIRRISATLKERNSLLTPSQRSSLFGLKGTNNGMYGKTHTEEAKKLISEKVSSYLESNDHHQKGKSIEEMYGKDKANRIRSGLSAAASARMGKLNPFYGKKHSEEIKKRMSENRKGRPSKTKKILIEGVVYSSNKEAAEALSVSPALITYRARSDKYDYSYC